MSESTGKTPFRALVVPQHLPFFDHVARMLRDSAMKEITLAPPLWAALCVALAESVQAHRILAAEGNSAARDRLPLVEALLVEITGADHVDEVLPPDFADLN
jgi:hypothetical protein